MSWTDFLPKAIKDAVLEGDETAAKPPASPAGAVKGAAPPPRLGPGITVGAAASMAGWQRTTEAQPSLVTAAPSGATDDAMYQKLLSHTSVDNCPGIKQVMEVASHLEKAIPDRSLRLKAAIAEVESRGVTAATVSAEVDSLFRALEGEQQKFQASITQHSRELVEQRQQAAAALQQEIEAKQKQMRELLVEAEANRGQIAAAETSFAAVSARRHSELDQLRSEFANLFPVATGIAAQGRK